MSGAMDSGASAKARAALEAVAAARSNAANRLLAPPWYYPVLGILAAGAVLMASLANVLVFLATLWVFTVGLGVLMGIHRERTGLWVPALHQGRASLWAWLLVAVYAVCLPVAILTGRLTSADWIAWVAAVVLFAATAFAGRRFNAAVRAQIRVEP